MLSTDCDGRNVSTTHVIVCRESRTAGCCITAKCAGNAKVEPCRSQIRGHPRWLQRIPLNFCGSVSYVHIVKTYRVPSLLYGCEVWNLSCAEYRHVNVV